MEVRGGPERPEFETEQGWSVKIAATKGDNKRVLQCRVKRPSVVSIRMLTGTDDAGFFTVETAVGESKRIRIVPVRMQGVALATPGGLVTVKAETPNGTAFSAEVEVAEGVSVTEHLGRIILLQAAATVVTEAVAFARSLTITVLKGSVSVLIPVAGGALALAAPLASVTIPAYSSVSITETSGANTASVSLLWECTT